MDDEQKEGFIALYDELTNGEVDVIRTMIDIITDIKEAGVPYETTLKIIDDLIIMETIDEFHDNEVINNVLRKHLTSDMYIDYLIILKNKS